MSPFSTESGNTSQRRLLTITTLFGIVISLLFVANLIIWLPVSASAGGTDLVGYFEGGARLRGGLPLYRTDIDLVSDPFHYIYPPLLAFLFYFFPSYQAAWWMWFGVSALCWLAALGLILRELRQGLRERLAPAWWPVLLAALISFSPVFTHLIWGQVQLLLLLLLVGSWCCLRRGRDRAAGVLLGIAIAVKLYPAALLLPLLLARRWRTLVLAGITAGGILGLSFAVVGWDTLVIYVTKILPQINHTTGFDNHAITNVLHKLLGDGSAADILSLLARMLIVGAVALCAARRSHAPDQGFALGVTMMVLIPQVVWGHYLVLLYLPWLDALARASRRQLALLALAFFLISTSAATFHVPPALLALAQALPLCGALLLLSIQIRQTFGAVASATVRSPAREEPAPSEIRYANVRGNSKTLPD